MRTQSLRGRQQRYYRRNKEHLKQVTREWKKAHKKQVKEYKEWSKKYMAKYRQNPEVKEKNKMRMRTKRKYGKLPNGFNFHHTTKPYNEDEWIGVHKSEHYSTGLCY